MQPFSQSICTTFLPNSLLLKEESSTWAKRTIDVASATEDAGAINKVHDAVFGGKQVFAVDAPDGEHDLEDVVSTLDRE